MRKQTIELLSPGEHQPKAKLFPIMVMQFNTGIMWGGFFMLIPLLAVHITENLMLGATLAGVVLAVRQFVQQGMGFLFGSLSDWFGYRRVMMLGFLVRAAGFAWIAVATEPFGLIMSSIVAAFGGALFESSGKAALAYLSKGYNRAAVFSMNSTVGNVGMAVGPLIGVALAKLDFKIVGFTSASVYLLGCLLLWLFVPPIPSVDHSKPSVGAVFSKMGHVMSNGKFVVLTVFMAGFFYLSTQLNITITLEAVKLSGSQDSVGLVYLLNSGLAICFQFLLVKWVSARVQPLTIIAFGVLMTTIGVTCFSFAGTFALFIVFLIIYSIGRLFVEPVSQALVTQYASEENMASYFGFSSLSLAFGGMLGSLTGGLLFELGNNINFPALCWIVFGGVGLLVVIGICGMIWYEKHPRILEYWKQKSGVIPLKGVQVSHTPLGGTGNPEVSIVE